MARRFACKAALRSNRAGRLIDEARGGLPPTKQASDIRRRSQLSVSQFGPYGALAWAGCGDHAPCQQMLSTPASVQLALRF